MPSCTKGLSCVPHAVTESGASAKTRTTIPDLSGKDISFEDRDRGRLSRPRTQRFAACPTVGPSCHEEPKGPPGQRQRHCSGCNSCLFAVSAIPITFLSPRYGCGVPASEAITRNRLRQIALLPCRMGDRHITKNWSGGQVNSTSFGLVIQDVRSAPRRRFLASVRCRPAGTPSIQDRATSRAKAIR